jgi:hypothetical protein
MAIFVGRVPQQHDTLSSPMKCQTPMLLFRHGLRRSLRPARTKLDLRLTTEAITQRLSDMTDAELAALEARMITISPTLALEHVDEPQVDGDADAEHGNDGDDCGTVQASYPRATSGSPMPVA